MRAVEGSLGHSPREEERIRRPSLDAPSWKYPGHPPSALLVKKSRAIVPCSLRCVDCVASRFTRFKMPEVPVKIYIDKLLKECSDVTRKLAILSGPVKEKALRAMADRVAADEEKI